MSKKISELIEHSIPTDNDVVPIVNSNTTKKITIANILAYIKTALANVFAPFTHKHTKSEITDFPSIPSKTSDLDNDSGYITGYTETDPTVPAWAKEATKPSYTYAEIGEKPTFSTVATSGSYNDLEDKPTIPNEYTLPTASADTLGGVKVGAGLSITDGVLSASGGGGEPVDLSNYYNKTEADAQFSKLSLYGDTTINIGRHPSTTTGEYSTALGYNTQASYKYSHAEGDRTNARAECSHAEGSETTVTGQYGHAEGKSTNVSGSYSHAEGAYTLANGQYQHVQGKYNLGDTTSAHIVGNGTSIADRKNIHTLNWDGTAWFQGDVYVKSSGGQNKDTGSKKLATEEFVTSQNYISSTVITAFWTGTQAEYDALGSYNATTLYLITE